MTEVIKVVKEKTVVVRSTTAIKIIHSGFQGLPGPRGLPGSGAEVLMEAGINLGGHRVVAPGPQGLEYADWNLRDTAMRVCGITMGAAAQGGEVSIRNYGEVQEGSWNWDLTKPVYLGSNGTLTQNVPGESGASFTLVVGFPSAPDTLFITIREPIFHTN